MIPKRRKPKAIEEVPTDIVVKASKIKLIETLPFTTICTHWGYDKSNQLLRVIFGSGGDYLYTNVTDEQFKEIDAEYGGMTLLNDIVCNDERLCYKLSNLDIKRELIPRKITEDEQRMINEWKQKLKYKKERMEDKKYKLSNEDLVKNSLLNIDTYNLSVNSTITHFLYGEGIISDINHTTGWCKVNFGKNGIHIILPVEEKLFMYAEVN